MTERGLVFDFHFHFHFLVSMIVIIFFIFVLNFDCFCLSFITKFVYISTTNNVLFPPLYNCLNPVTTNWGSALYSLKNKIVHAF